jgi:hypothetical protein
MELCLSLSKHSPSDELNSASGDQWKGARQITVSPLSLPTETEYEKQTELENCYLFSSFLICALAERHKELPNPLAESKGTVRDFVI